MRERETLTTAWRDKSARWQFYETYEQQDGELSDDI
jgi:hypothetical protein